MTEREQQLMALAKALYAMQQTLWLARGWGSGTCFNLLELTKKEDWLTKAERLIDRFTVIDKEATV